MPVFLLPQAKSGNLASQVKSIRAREAGGRIKPGAQAPGIKTNKFSEPATRAKADPIAPPQEMIYN